MSDTSRVARPSFFFTKIDKGNLPTALAVLAVFGFVGLTLLGAWK
jgi:hypothetical protein